MKGGIDMSENKLSKDWIKKNGYKLKIAYSYAVVNKYDLNSTKDVLEVLKKVDPANANEENAKIFSGMLQLFARGVRKKFELKPKTKTRIVH